MLIRHQHCMPRAMTLQMSSQVTPIQVIADFKKRQHITSLTLNRKLLRVDGTAALLAKGNGAASRALKSPTL